MNKLGDLWMGADFLWNNQIYTLLGFGENEDEVIALKVQWDEPIQTGNVAVSFSRETEVKYLEKNRGNKEDRILELLRLKCLCRIRGLRVDIQNGYKFEGRLLECEELLRHLDKLKWIIADIECAEKYLSKEEKEKFERLKRNGR